MPYFSDQNAVNASQIPKQTLIAALVVFVITLLVLVYMCQQIREKSNLVTITNFRMLSDERISRVKNRLLSEARRLEGAKRFIENSDVTTQAEFDGFVTPFLYPNGAYLLVRALSDPIHKTAALVAGSSSERGFDCLAYSKTDLVDTSRQASGTHLLILYASLKTTRHTRWYAHQGN